MTEQREAREQDTDLCFSFSCSFFNLSTSCWSPVCSSPWRLLTVTGCQSSVSWMSPFWVSCRANVSLSRSFLTTSGTLIFREPIISSAFVGLPAESEEPVTDSRRRMELKPRKWSCQDRAQDLQNPTSQPCPLPLPTALYPKSPSLLTSFPWHWSRFLWEAEVLLACVTKVTHLPYGLHRMSKRSIFECSTPHPARQH